MCSESLIPHGVLSGHRLSLHRAFLVEHWVSHQGKQRALSEFTKDLWKQRLTIRRHPCDMMLLSSYHMCLILALNVCEWNSNEEVIHFTVCGLLARHWVLPASVKGKPHLSGCLWPGHLAGPPWQCKHLPSRWRSSDPFRQFHSEGRRASC